MVYQVGKIDEFTNLGEPAELREGAEVAEEGTEGKLDLVETAELPG